MSGWRAAARGGDHASMPIRHFPTDRRARVETFLAVVHAADGVRFAAAADSRAELVRHLAEYVARRAAHVLHAEHARYVRGLLARGELEAAVEAYFGLVGGRWDDEWLVTGALTRDAWWDVTAALDMVAPAPNVMPRSREA